MKNSDQSAFAAVAIDGNNSHFEAGLTKREYFAAIAMQGILSTGSGHEKQIAEAAVIYADALLSELEKPA